MTLDQFNRAKEIERKVADLQSRWNFANTPGASFTGPDGRPIDTETALRDLRARIEKEHARLMKEFEAI